MQNTVSIAVDVLNTETLLSNSCKSVMKDIRELEEKLDSFIDKFCADEAKKNKKDENTETELSDNCKHLMTGVWELKWQLNLMNKFFTMDEEKDKTNENEELKT